MTRHLLTISHHPSSCSQCVGFIDLDIMGNKTLWEVHYAENQFGEYGTDQNNGSNGSISAAGN